MALLVWRSDDLDQCYSAEPAKIDRKAQFIGPENLNETIKLRICNYRFITKLKGESPSRTFRLLFFCFYFVNPQQDHIGKSLGGNQQVHLLRILRRVLVERGLNLPEAFPCSMRFHYGFPDRAAGAMLRVSASLGQSRIGTLKYLTALVTFNIR